MAGRHVTNGHSKEDQEEILSENYDGTDQDIFFDTIIGHLQDLIIDDEFSALQNTFMDKYYHEFEDVEENKLIYTDIQKEYIELIEKYIETKLMDKSPGFNMDKFLGTLKSRKSEIPEEIFEIFLSFTNFFTFKQMFLDYKADKEGLVPNLDGLIIKSAIN